MAIWQAATFGSSAAVVFDAIVVFEAVVVVLVNGPDEAPCKGADAVELITAGIEDDCFKGKGTAWVAATNKAARPKEDMAVIS